jgi:hypothetical protein
MNTIAADDIGPTQYVSLASVLPQSSAPIQKSVETGLLSPVIQLIHVFKSMYGTSKGRPQQLT